MVTRGTAIGSIMVMMADIVIVFGFGAPDSAVYIGEYTCSGEGDLSDTEDTSWEHATSC